MGCDDDWETALSLCVYMQLVLSLPWTSTRFLPARNILPTLQSFFFSRIWNLDTRGLSEIRFKIKKITFKISKNFLTWRNFRIPRLFGDYFWDFFRQDAKVLKVLRTRKKMKRIFFSHPNFAPSADLAR